MAQTTKNTPVTGASEAFIAGDQSGEPANIAAASEFSSSGAPVQTSGGIDVNNPAVDNDPRAGTTVEQNQIDFNDPRPNKGSETVAALLNDQGLPTKVAKGGAETHAVDHTTAGTHDGSVAAVVDNKQ